MAKATLVFRFTAPLVRHETALGVTHILPVPAEVAAAWKKAKVRRLVGTINGHPVNRGLQHHADGGSYLTLGRPLLREIGLGPKVVAAVELGPDPKANEPDLPEELQAALEQDAEARARWETFPQGMRRSLASYVTSAKQGPTRIKRALELAHKIRTRGLHRDRQRPVSST